MRMAARWPTMGMGFFLRSMREELFTGDAAGAIEEEEKGRFTRKRLAAAIEAMKKRKMKGRKADRKWLWCERGRRLDAEKRVP